MVFYCSDGNKNEDDDERFFFFFFFRMHKTLTTTTRDRIEEEAAAASVVYTQAQFEVLLYIFPWKGELRSYARLGTLRLTEQ